MSNFVFIAKYPTGWLEKDGASIRFLAIDSIFKNYERIYIESFNFPLHNFLFFAYRDIKRKYNKLPQISNSLIKNYKYLGKKKTYKIFDKAKFIYIENFTNLAKLDLKLIEKYGYKMILDFHGCVIEEMEMMKAPSWKINNMRKYEECALNHIRTFVSVSDNMTKYFQTKYPKCQCRNFILLPIYNDNKIKYENKRYDQLNIIYSGKNLVWQNSELMIKSISEIINNNVIKNINFTFLTPDIKSYTELAKKYNIESILKIKSISPSELNKEYAKAHFGFILREDNVVNRVACPTKLVEYMKAGIIPIVLQPEIGDFNKLGYKYILNEDLINGNIPTLEEQEEMRITNYKIIENLSKQIEESKQELRNKYS